jgi:ketosteroid isomerase-like protein
MAIRTNPSYSTAHENLGDIYAKLASQAYNKALQLDTGNAAVPTKLALIREIFNNPKGSHTATNAQQGATPTAKPPVVAVVPVAPPIAIASVPPKPFVTTPAASVASTPAPTPTVVTKPPPESATPKVADTASGTQIKELEAAVANWASAWSARDVKSYLAAYGKDFDTPGSIGRKAWEEERTQRILGKSTISVKVDKLVVSVNGARASAKFRQDYKAGGLAVTSHKTLDFAKVGERWQIVKETVGN